LKRITKKSIDAIMKIIYEKKGYSILCIDLRKFDTITDFFIICSAESDQHTRAIAEELIEKLEGKYFLHHIEGIEYGHWILLDYIDFIIHIFTEEERQFYNIERLWGDAKMWGYNEEEDRGES